jgi:uncharacterized membrane protein
MPTSAAEITQWVVRGVLAAIFIGMGINHFRPRMVRGMAAMIPPRMRWSGALSPRNLVYFTGACEIAGGIGIVVPATHTIAGFALVVFLIAVFPANAYAAKYPDKFGRAAIPFWPRLIAQIVLIALCVFAAL